jgi:hypothetical protein
VAIVTMFVAATIALPQRPAPVAAATLSAETQPLHQSSDVALAAQLDARPSAPTAVRAAVAPVAAPGASGESSEVGGLSISEKNRIAESPTPAAAVAAIAEALARETPTTEWAFSEPITSEPAQVSTAPVESGTVTVTGCLEADATEHQFRLTDTEGVDVPTSRNWRTGFLKKQSTSVALVEAPDPRTLQAHVGQRVAADGLLTNRELRVTSLRVIGPRCN